MEQEAYGKLVGGASGGAFGLLIIAVLGLLVGAVAKLLMPGKDPGGWLVTMALGIVGSWVGSLLLALFHLSGVIPRVVGAVVGAMLLLGVYRILRKR